MKKKVIIRSSNVDRHGDYISLEQLKQYVETVNGDMKMRYLANHRRDIPPIGYLDNSEIIQERDVYHIIAEPIEFSSRRIPDWDENLIIEEVSRAIIFKSRKEKCLKDIRISLDKNNFKSFEAYNSLSYKLNDLHNGNIEFEGSMRKSLELDPQIVITLAKYSIIFYPLIKPILKKIGEKIADDISDYLYEEAKSKVKKMTIGLNESINLIKANILPNTKKLLTIFEIPGDPCIELHIKSDDSKKIFKALEPRKLAKVHLQIQALQENLELSEAYFIMNGKDKWQFSYLITKSGQVVGTKSAFSKRDKLIKRINLSPTKAFSIGADGVKYNKVSK